MSNAAGVQDKTAQTTGQVAEWRRVLAQGRAVLQRAFEANGSPRALLTDHSRLVDRLLQTVWRTLRLPRAFALLGVGGYGRGELYPYSDVDLLLLLPDGARAADRESVEPLIAAVWDVGLEVGHSVRTVKECREEAERDVTIQTNLLEARLVAGDPELYRAFDHAVRRRLDPVAFFEAKHLEQQQRHTRFHDTAYNLEPNIKENPGALRDLQHILWISRAQGIGNGWNGLVREGMLTVQEARQIGRRESFLQTLRIRLHYLAGRREDRLLFDYQTRIAHQQRLVDKPHRMASEQLMQRYYRAAKFNRLMNEILLQNLRARIFPAAVPDPVAIDDRFQSRGELLEARDEALYEKDRCAILETFLVLEKRPELKGIATPTLRALWRAGKSVDARFRGDPRNRALFMDILRAPRGLTHVLRRMNQYGILGRYLPAFGRIIGRMQHDLFHVYTVDEHILFVIRNLRRFTMSEFAHEFPLCSRLMSAYDRPETLYIAALFHDIAKGRGGDHSRLGSTEARRFCTLHSLERQDTELITWLVEDHLVMSTTAQKQDLSDPAVIAAFANRVRNERRLNALYLLTVADIRGTSPKVWNAWKGKLLEELYFATQRYLSSTGFTLDTHLQTRQIEALQILRSTAFEPGAHQALWAVLDDGYFLRHDAREIAWHTRMLHAHVDTSTPIVRARPADDGAGIHVMIYTPDRDDLFARISGFFERTNYNIVEAKIQTTRHGYALDSFLVLDETNRSGHPRELLGYIEHELARRLTRDDSPEAPVQRRLSRQLKHVPITPRVSITPDEKGTYHVLSVTTGDRPGLLSRIAQVFVKHHVHLHTAKVTTLGERAEDTFLVTADDDRLNDPRAVLLFECDLLEQIRY